MNITAAFLADSAIVANGKLYVHGGGWDTIYTATFPTTHPSMALAFVVRVEYSEAPGSIPFVIELRDEDEEIRPEFQGSGQLNVGHAPGTKHGSPIFVPQAVTINMLQFLRPEALHFNIIGGGEQLASVPFRIVETSQIPRPA